MEVIGWENGAGNKVVSTENGLDLGYFVGDLGSVLCY